MKRLKNLLFATAAAVALAGGTAARADISWQANWTPGTNSLSVGPSSQITFTNLASAGYTTTAAQPVITTPVTNLAIVTTAPTTSPDVFVDKGYVLGLQITDMASLKTMNLTFSGSLSGTISVGGASITNTFNTPTTQSVTFANGDKYTVTLDGFVPPGSGTNITTQGAIGADVTATGPGGGGGSPHGTPEPSTLALGGLGMAFTGLMAWRRRRNAALAA
jgi:hypothetical protein